MDCLTPRILSQKVAVTNVSSAPKYMHLQGWLLKSSSFDIWAKCKKKYLMRQIPIKMLKQHGIPNSSLHNLKIYSSKGCRKTSQRHTATLNIRIFSQRYHFRLWHGFLLRLVNTFTIDIDECYPMC